MSRLLSRLLYSSLRPRIEPDASGFRVTLLLASSRLFPADVCACQPLGENRLYYDLPLASLCIASVPLLSWKGEKPGSPESFSPPPQFAACVASRPVVTCLLCLGPSPVPVAFPWLVHHLSIASFLFPLRQIHLLLHELLSLNTTPGVGCFLCPCSYPDGSFPCLLFPPKLSRSSSWP